MQTAPREEAPFSQPYPRGAGSLRGRRRLEHDLAGRRGVVGRHLHGRLAGHRAAARGSKAGPAPRGPTRNAPWAPAARAPRFEAASALIADGKPKEAEAALDARPTQATRNGFYTCLALLVLAAWLEWKGALA